MSLAKGTQSALLFQEEQGAYAETPQEYMPRKDRYLSFVSEALGGSINQIISEEIRHDRAVASVRGGNIAANGNITTEFGPLKNGVLLKHLLGKTIGDFAALVTMPFVPSKWYDRGMIVYSIDDDNSNQNAVYICTQAGKAGAETHLDSTELTQESGSTVWRKVSDGTSTFGYRDFLPQSTEDFLSKGLTIEKQLEGGEKESYIQFSGVRVNSLTLNLPQEGIVRADWNLIAMKQYSLGQVFVPTVNEVKWTAGEQVGTTGVADQMSFDSLPVLIPKNGDRVRFEAKTGALPNGIDAAVWYYLRDVNAEAGTFKIALTSGGSAVDIGTSTEFYIFCDGDPAEASTDQPFVGADFLVYMARSAEATLLRQDLATAKAAEADLLVPRAVREGSVTISNQFDESIFTSGTRSRSEVPEGVRSVTGSLTMYFKTADEFKAFIGEETVTFEFILMVGDYMMRIRLPYCKVTGDGTPKVAGPGVLTATYNFTAFKLGSEDDISIRVYGTEANLLPV